MLQLQWQQNATATATKRIEKSRQLAPLPLLGNQSQATRQAACPRRGGTHAQSPVPSERPQEP